MTSRDRSADIPLVEITSAANPRVKQLRAIASSRGVRRHRRALVCGRRIVEQVSRRQSSRIEALVYPSRDPALERELERRRLDAAASGGAGRGGEPSAASAPELLVLPAALFREVDPFGVEPPLAVLRVDPLLPWDPAQERHGLTLLLPLGDPENVGAALRSAAAFEVERVVLLEEAAHPFHPRAIRASAGTCFDLDLRAGPSMASLIDQAGAIELLVLDRGGEALGEIEPAADRSLLVGEEGRGVPEHAGWRRVTIPISDRVESLNAAVAVGIALWELRRPPRRK